MIFTSQERRVLMSLAFGMTIALSLQIILTRFPSLMRLVDGVEESRYVFSVDINTADYDALLRIPYIGPATARSILEYRETHGPFQSLDELRQLPYIREDNLKIFRSYLRVR